MLILPSNIDNIVSIKLLINNIILNRENGRQCYDSQPDEMRNYIHSNTSLSSLSSRSSHISFKVSDIDIKYISFHKYKLIITIIEKPFVTREITIGKEGEEGGGGGGGNY